VWKSGVQWEDGSSLEIRQGSGGELYNDVVLIFVVSVVSVRCVVVVVVN